MDLDGSAVGDATCARAYPAPSDLLVSGRTRKARYSSCPGRRRGAPPSTGVRFRSVPSALLGHGGGGYAPWYAWTLVALPTLRDGKPT